MNRKQKLIVSITGITIVLLALLGITYGYYLTRIEGNTNINSISLSTADLKLVYKNGTNDLITSNDPIEPGKFSSTMDFTVTNDGNQDIDEYAVVLEELKITYVSNSVLPDGTSVRAGDLTSFVYPKDMKLEIECESSVSGNTCSGLTNGYLPESNDILVKNSIKKDEVQTYRVTLTYIDSGIDQSADMNKSISGKINIIDSKNTLNVVGNIESYNSGDYVVVRSEPKYSKITNGTYKVLGLTVGEHTITVYNKNGEELGNGTFVIKQGETPKVDGNIITMNSSSDSVNINISNSYNVSVGEISIGNPFKLGTLAYNIINSAKKNLNGTEFKETPYSEIGKPSRYHNGIYRDIKLTDIDYGYFYNIYFNTANDAYNLANDIQYLTYDQTYYNPAVGFDSDCNDSVFGKYTATLYSYGEYGIAEPFKVVGCDGNKPIVNTDLYYESLLSIEKDNYGTSYYFRGDVKDNYVSFANKTWKIVRIAGDGSVVLLDRNNLDTHYINTSFADSVDLYYSDLNRKFNEYINQFSSSDLSKMKMSDWCLRMTEGFKCQGNDLVEVNNGVDQYGNLTEVSFGYVSLLTKQEAIYAGLSSDWYSHNAKTYLKDYYILMDNNYIQHSLLAGSYYEWYSALVIALKPDIKISGGDGTQSNPYIIN